MGHKQTQKQRKLYYIRRKVAFTQVFASHDDRGSAPTDVAAVMHPLYGTIAQLAAAMQALHSHHTVQATPLHPHSDAITGGQLRPFYYAQADSSGALLP